MGNPPWDLRVSKASNGDDDEVADDELRNMSLRSDHVIMEATVEGRCYDLGSYEKDDLGRDKL